MNPTDCADVAHGMVAVGDLGIAELRLCRARTVTAERACTASAVRESTPCHCRYKSYSCGQSLMGRIKMFSRVPGAKRRPHGHRTREAWDLITAREQRRRTPMRHYLTCNELRVSQERWTETLRVTGLNED